MQSHSIASGLFWACVLVACSLYLQYELEQRTPSARAAVSKKVEIKRFHRCCDHRYDDDLPVYPERIRKAQYRPHPRPCRAPRQLPPPPCFFPCDY